MRGTRPVAGPGFTFVEVIISVALGAALLMLVLTSFLDLSHSALAITHYRDLHSDARHALDIMSRDIVAASEVSAYVSPNSLDIQVVSTSGVQSVRYYLLGEDLHRVFGGSDRTLATGLDALAFSLFTESGASTSTPVEAHSVDVLMEMTAQGVRDTYTDVLQVRRRMRNKGI